MIFIYYVLVSIVLVVAGPFLLLKKKTRAGLAQKLGVIDQEFRSGIRTNGIWIHAVSVGEFNAVWPLVKRLAEELPDIPLYLSTTTATGQALAKERVGNFASVFYFPLDLPFATKSWLDLLQPRLVAIAETEIWPGFAHQCKTRGIKLVTVNGRISPSSFKTYYSLRSFFAQVFQCYTAFGVQTESEAERFKTICGGSTRVCVLGNLKLDSLLPVSPPDIEALKKTIGISADDFIVVAGSTHEGEESALLDAFRVLRQEHEKSAGKRPRLIIAPRHPERFAKAAATIGSYGFTIKRNSADDRFEQNDDVYLLDSLGQLAKFYGLASLAFVGGTITNIGGHNVAEPYTYSVPVCCGPHIQKTFDVASALSACEAIVIANDAAALSDAILDLYRNPEKASNLGRRGKVWIEENQGAVERTLAFLQNEIDGSHTNQSTRSGGEVVMETRLR